MGLEGGDFVVMEKVEEGWLLKPAIVVEYGIYSDEKLKRMAEQDAWTPAQRKSLAEEDRRQSTVMRVFLDANLLFSAAPFIVP